MDILKVLSRGTKKPSKTCIAKTGTVAALKLPSAGTEANPQLFHDDISQKRKRTVDMEDEKGMVKVRKVVVEGAEDLPEVDFFAQKMEGAEGGEEKVVVVAEEEEDDEESEDEEEERERLSEEECKEMLRSHRLKVTLLSKAPEPMVETKKKKKKKGKKEEVVEEEKSKKVKKQEKRVFPAPLECFDDLRRTYRVSRKLAENIAEQAYKIPTEVQMGALPLLINVAKALGEADARVVGGEERLERVDLLSVAPTGSGKTVGFLVPAINAIVGRREKVAENERREGFHELEAVVLAPTRELAYQIVNEARKLTKGMGLKVVLMKKGMRLAAEHNAEVSLEEEDDENDDDEESGSEKESQDENDDKDGPMTAVDILVTTPMPLLNYLTKSSTSKTPMVLPTVRSLILDEADVLLDQLFHDQTTCLWSLFTNPTLQHSLWSATMGSNIETLVASLLSSRATRLNTPPHPLLRLVVGLKDTAVPNIRHKLIFTGSELGKLYAIRQLLRPGPRTNDTISIRPPFIVFAQSIERAAALQDELRYDIPLAAGGSSRIAALHSGLTDSQRAAIMRQFRAGEIWILITTDVLARGVDFAGVNGVVNYDIPGSAAVYIHRAGRTGRAGREGGIAVTLWTKDDIPYVKIIANVITASDKQAGRTGEDLGVPESLLASLPTVSKAEKKKLKERGVEARRRGGQSAKITTKSGWERKKENTKEAAVEQSKRKKWLEKQQKKAARGAEKGKEEGKEEEWGGIDD